jgi:hypothetical protein
MSCILNIGNELTAAKLELIAFRKEEAYRNPRRAEKKGKHF